MVSIIDYKTLIPQINQQTTELLSKFNIHKSIPFDVNLTDITLQSFLKEYDIYLEQIIQKEIIPQILRLHETSHSVIYEQKSQELKQAYQTFKSKNAEFYNVLIPKNTQESQYQLKSSIEQSTIERSKMKALIKDEKYLKDQLERIKLDKMRMINEKTQRHYHLKTIEDNNYNTIITLIIVIIVLLSLNVFIYLKGLY